MCTCVCVCVCVCECERVRLKCMCVHAGTRAYMCASAFEIQCIRRFAGSGWRVPVGLPGDRCHGEEKQKVSDLLEPPLKIPP